MIKNIYLFLTAIILCTGCNKGTSNITQNNIDNPASASTLFSAVDNDTISPQMPENETKSLLHETIEGYGNIAPEMNHTNPIDRNVLAFQIEGNFTNSGNREIIAFYELIAYKEICVAICFVFDSNGEKVENIYFISEFGYGINLWPEEFDFENEKGLRVLWKPIIWEGRKIGYVGDFNEDGKEELFLYLTSAIGRVPKIFEFEETGFKYFPDINVIERRDAEIIYIDHEKKIIGIRLDIRLDNGIIIDEFAVARITTTTSYIWNKADQRYEILNTETKEYRWNRDTSQYEEL